VAAVKPIVSPAESVAPVVSVFGSSKVADGSEAHQQALELGAALAGAGFSVATGGYSGVMEAVSRGAAGAGGRVIGVVASSLPGKCNRWVTEEVVVETWEQRLFRLIALGNSYVACPGATGTLVELSVAWELMSKDRLSRRPLIALGTFWRPIVEQIEAVEENTRGFVSVAESVAMVLATLREAIGEAIDSR
jgi:uncharacterized protein (TIGR00730 family)